MRLLWHDDAEEPVRRDGPVVKNWLKNYTAMAEAEHPTDQATDANGWTEVSDVYAHRSKATRAVVELHLQWAPLGQVEWSSIS